MDAINYGVLLIHTDSLVINCSSKRQVDLIKKGTNRRHHQQCSGEDKTDDESLA